MLEAAGNAIKEAVREVLPKPGYPGDKPEFKTLRDTISIKIKNYQGGFYKVLIVGYELPMGAHGHLVDFGHDMAANTFWNGQRLVTLRGTAETGERVEGKHYFSTAVRMVQHKIDKIILTSAAREAAKVPPHQPQRRSDV